MTPPTVELPPIGTTIYKDFPGYGGFYGQVVFYTFHGRFVRVVYTDGDSEDLDPPTVWRLSCLPSDRLYEIPFHLKQPTLSEVKQGAVFYPPVSSVGRAPAFDGAKSEKVDDEKHSRRSSKRMKKSTVVYIGKDAVKRENNYEVRGMKYQYNVEESTGPPASSLRRSQPQQPRSSLNKGPSKPRHVSPEEKARLATKLRLEQNIRDKEAARQAFLYQHRAVLEPFCPSSVLPTSPPTQKSPLREHEEVMQPDAIQADLRDYQLAGLNFMISMYRQNMSMILGDGAYSLTAFFFFSHRYTVG